jgi:CO/xanthine dehydrogenase Mo-binding subunit
MSTSTPNKTASGLSRRTFLQSSSLTVAFSLVPVLPGMAQAPAKPVLPGALNNNRMLDGWLRINPNGTVTMCTGKVEIGQGILTALSQIVADELDVGVQRLVVISGHTGVTPNEGMTAGSLSIQDSGTALRFACAEARSLLLEAAALQLQTQAYSLTVRDGNIFTADGVQRTSYWSLTNAPSLQREASAKVTPKPSSQHKLIGSSLPRRDIPGKVTGAEAYVQDMRLPDMLYGRVVRPPAPRAKLISVDLAAVRAMPGVQTVVRDGHFLGVAAVREEQAIAAARALAANARWQEPGDLPPSGPALFAHMKQQDTADSVVSNKTDAAAAARGVKQVQAEYTKPYQSHGSIGPSCAVAQWNDGKLVVWSHTQGVYPLRGDLAKGFRMPLENVTVIHKEGSGCYGHNGADDVAMDAALVARAAGGKPVKLQWSREDEFAWEPLGSPMSMKLNASLDSQGKVVDWSHELWSYAHSTRPYDPDGVNLLGAWHIENPLPAGPSRNIPQPSGGSDRNALPLYVFPQQKVTNHLLKYMPIRTSALRTLGAYANVFAIESFMDELAATAGIDPLTFRLNHMVDPRAREVMERTAAMAKWKPGVAKPPAQLTGVLKGRGMGFAKYKNLAIYTAVVADVEVDTRSGVVRVTHAWSANDAGLVINPDGLINQVEGGIIQSASWTLMESMRHSTQRNLVRNWADYPIMRFSEVPAVHVELINRPEERPLGAGEGSQGPAVAAIANAFANATGRRLRNLPFTVEHVKQVLS